MLHRTVWKEATAVSALNLVLPAAGRRSTDCKARVLFGGGRGRRGAGRDGPADFDMSQSCNLLLV